MGIFAFTWADASWHADQRFLCCLIGLVIYNCERTSVRRVSRFVLHRIDDLYVFALIEPMVHTHTYIYIYIYIVYLYCCIIYLLFVCV